MKHAFPALVTGNRKVVKQAHPPPPFPAYNEIMAEDSSKNSFSRLVGSALGLGRRLVRKSYTSRIHKLGLAGPHTIALDFTFLADSTVGQFMLDGRALKLKHDEKQLDGMYLDGLLSKYIPGRGYKRPSYSEVARCVENQEKIKPLDFTKTSTTQYCFRYRYDCGAADLSFSLTVDVDKGEIHLKERTVATCWDR